MLSLKKTSGNVGESLAIKLLQEKKYKILEKNFSTKLGEIDLIAQDISNTIVFVEVKTRTSLKFGYPREAINRAKINHIRKTALLYLKKKNLLDKVSVRFDCIEILGDKFDYKIEHIENIF